MNDETPDTLPPSTRRLSGEIIFNLALLIASLVLAHQAWSIAGFASLTSAGVFPMLAAGTMVVSAVFILADSARKTPPEKRGMMQALSLEIISLRTVVFAVLIVGYMMALRPLGFVLASYLFLAAAMMFLHRRNYLYLLLLSAIAVAVVYFLFRYVFVVVLPRGMFF
jgi:putative tricarboxylic transport membrane protein